MMCHSARVPLAAYITRTIRDGQGRWGGEGGGGGLMVSVVNDWLYSLSTFNSETVRAANIYFI